MNPYDPQDRVVAQFIIGAVVAGCFYWLFDEIRHWRIRKGVEHRRSRAEGTQ